MAEKAVATAKASEAKQRCPNSCKQNVGFNSSGSPADRILQLQRTAGNQAVQRLIKSRALQAKLKISKPNDIYEQEAERVADQVVGMQDLLIKSQSEGEKIRAKTLASEITPIVQRQSREEENNGEKGEIRANESGNNSLDKNLQNRLIQLKEEGSPLPEPTRAFMESRFGTDLSSVKVHKGSGAVELGREINALAFTSGKDIYFGENQYRPGTVRGDRLLAHEITHVVQQRGNSSQPGSSGHMFSGAKNIMVARKSATSSAKMDSKTSSTPAEDIAPGVVELKDSPKFEPGGPISDFFNKKKTGKVHVRFGELAEGTIDVKKEVKKSPKSKDTSVSYRINNQSIPLKHHPLFAPSDLEPNLILNTDKEGYIEGHVRIGKKEKGALISQLKETPDLIGLAGFDLGKLDRTFSNKLEKGTLEIGLRDAQIKLGGAFRGTLTLMAINESVTFNGIADINVQGLGSGQLTLNRSEGLITGKGEADVKLTDNISGKVKVIWTGEVIEGEGSIGYRGEKLSGNVHLKVMEKTDAERLTIEKKALPDGEAAGKNENKTKNKDSKLDYAVFGEGDLTFFFNEWLQGTAHTIVDMKGDATIIGKITPQKEFELFPQKPYNKEIFKLKARAGYGIPVVGSISIIASVNLDAYAVLGPARFYNIEVGGTYSTDPKQKKGFSICGNLNISAAAGLTLRGEAKAGFEILGHDITAGVGVSGIAGINGYVEATPVIVGYREKGEEGEDKKGEFFIHGDIEMAAQPFLGLSGDLFIDIDAPWWSPLSDKRWPWPLGDKEWLLEGNIGVGASIDHVFGSKQFPSIDFKKVDFSPDKFLTDLYNDKTKAKSGELGKQKGKWSEKNTKDEIPPTPSGKKGDIKEGEPHKLAPAKPTTKPSKSKKADKPIDPNTRTAEGKTVGEFEEEALKKGKKPEGKELKGTGKGEEKGKPEIKEKKEHDEQLKEGLAALDAVTARYAKDGATEEEVKTGVKAVRRNFKVFKSINVIDGGETWDYEYEYNPKEKKKGSTKRDQPNRYLPKGYDVREKLYIRGSGWKRVRKEVFDDGIENIKRRLESVLEDKQGGNEDRARNRLKILIHEEKIPRNTDLNHLSKKYIDNIEDRAKYHVDHITPLAEHWITTGFKSGDNSRWNTAKNKNNIRLITEEANLEKGGGGYQYSQKPYVGPNFKSEYAENNKPGAKKIDGEPFLDK